LIVKIAIIGSGNVGRALATSSVRAGHKVTLSSAHPEKARQVAQATGAQAADSNKKAIEGADLVVLAVPFGAIDEVVKELGEGLQGKTVVDVTNPLKPDMSGLAVNGTSVAEEIQSRVPAAHVTKAFNTVFAAPMSNPQADGNQVDGLVAGNDGPGKTAVIELLRSLGFRPIDAGPLTMARTLEAMAFLNITLQVRNGWSWQSSWKLIGPTPVKV
jgi:NADPH-dependent F420 reductase